MSAAVKKGLVGALALVGLLSTVFFFLGAAAAFSATFDQCPDGNDCEDAISATAVCGVLGVVALSGATAAALYLRKLIRMRTALE